MTDKPERKNTFDPNNSLHVIKVSGRSFITFVGLQARLADQGKSVVGTDTEILQTPTKENGNTVYVKVTTEVAGKDGKSYSFKSVSDASPESVGKMIVPHLLRMAETRGHARNLRMATRSEFTSIDEINRDEMKGE